MTSLGLQAHCPPGHGPHGQPTTFGRRRRAALPAALQPQLFAGGPRLRLASGLGVGVGVRVLVGVKVTVGVRCVGAWFGLARR